jgi:hypothetical protein
MRKSERSTKGQAASRLVASEEFGMRMNVGADTEDEEQVLANGPTTAVSTIITCADREVDGGIKKVAEVIPAEPLLPAELHEVIELQQSALAQQLKTLDALVRQHLTLSGGLDPFVMQSRRASDEKIIPRTPNDEVQYAPRLIHPSRDEIALVHMLDAQGGLLTRAHVAELLTLMSRTKGVARKATILVALRRSFKTKILDYFVATGGLSQLTVWLGEFVEADDAEAIQLTLNFLMELPAGPDLALKIKESGLAKIVQKLRKKDLLSSSLLVPPDRPLSLASPSDTTTVQAHPAHPATVTKDLAEKVALTWKVLVKGARHRPIPVAPSTSSSEGGSRSGKHKIGGGPAAAAAVGNRALKRPRKEFGAINGKANVAPSDVIASKQNGGSGASSRKAEVDREREERIAGRKHNAKARTNLANMDTKAIKNKTAEAKRQRQERIQEQRKLRQEQAQRAEEERQRRHEDARQRELLRQEQKQRAQMERTARTGTGSSKDVLRGTATNDQVVFSKIAHMDNDGEVYDDDGGNSGKGDEADKLLVSRRIRWGDQVEGRALFEIREFVTEKFIDVDGDGGDDGTDDCGEGSNISGSGSMNERRKREQEKERMMMEAAKADRAAKRSMLWTAIENFTAPPPPAGSDSVLSGPIRLQGAGAQVDGFESIEVPVQEQRESAILEVFASRSDEGGPTDPADFFFGHEETPGGGDVDFIPLYSSKDFQMTARPLLRDLIMDDERSAEFEAANLAAGPIPEEAVAVARGMLQYMSDEQKSELRQLFPIDLPNSSALRFDQLWASAEEVAVEEMQGELPTAFQDLSPAVIAWLANNQDVVLELINDDTGEIDPEKLKITVEGLYANNLVPRPDASSSVATPVRAPEPVQQQDPRSAYEERMRQLNAMGRGRGMGVPLGVGAAMGMANTQRPPAPTQGGVMGANGMVNGVPVDKLIAAVLVQFKRGRKEQFRVDDPALQAKCAAFNEPYFIWIECNSNGNPGQDVGKVIEQMGRNKAGDTFQMRRALRIATPEEQMVGFPAKHQAEQDALQMARNLARDMGLPMSIEDTEWQFDKNKLTIFYSADGRVDFRDFVKKMGSHNKTFLWMERSDGKAPPNVPAMSSNQGIGGHGGMLSMGGIGSMGMMGGGAQLCNDFLKGKCIRGVGCKFSHDASSMVGGNGNSAKPICMDFQRGACARGASCIFSHVPGGSMIAMPGSSMGMGLSMGR